MGNYIPGIWRRSWSRFFRVVVFLCSYGFILLLIFVLFSTVAGENISRYYEWRENLPSAAFHRTDFKDPELAWQRIARDAEAGSPWRKLAQRLMGARNKVDRPLIDEKAMAAEIGALESMPWIIRLFPPLMRLGPVKPWSADGFQFEKSFSELYDSLTSQEKYEAKVAKEIASSVLGLPRLYEDLGPVWAERPVEIADNAALAARFIDQAKVLAASLPRAVRLNGAAPGADPHQQPSRPETLPGRVHAGPRTQGRIRVDRLGPRPVDEDSDIPDRAGGLESSAARSTSTRSPSRSFTGGTSSIAGSRSRRGRGWIAGSTRRGRPIAGASTGNSGRTPHADGAPAPADQRDAGGEPVAGRRAGGRQDIFTFSRVASAREDGVLAEHHRSRDDQTHQFAGQAERPRHRQHRDHLGGVPVSRQYRQPRPSAILHLLNIQTGYWAHRPKEFERRSPTRASASTSSIVGPRSRGG